MFFESGLAGFTDFLTEDGEPGEDRVMLDAPFLILAVPFGDHIGENASHLVGVVTVSGSVVEVLHDRHSDRCDLDQLTADGRLGASS